MGEKSETEVVPESTFFTSAPRDRVSRRSLRKMVRIITLVRMVKAGGPVGSLPLLHSVEAQGWEGQQRAPGEAGITLLQAKPKDATLSGTSHTLP